ncbi:MAG TPA: DUF1707 domain-containing protein [Nocardioides sp.]|nr:DUF1707 domain-containing protein [Nocardioides sp.]
MTTGSSGSLWSRFEHDPRDPSYAGMRASDRDRAVVQDALAEAYAEGRIDREELDERTTQVDAAKRYGDLLPPLQDLTVDAAAPAVSTTSRPDLQRQAEAHYIEERNEALMGFLIPNLICWAIWFMTGHDGFVWPVFVLIPTGGNLVRVLAGKQSIVNRRVEKLERKQAKALEPRQVGTAKPSKPSKPARQGSSDSSSRILSDQEEPEEA